MVTKTRVVLVSVGLLSIIVVLYFLNGAREDNEFVTRNEEGELVVVAEEREFVILGKVVCDDCQIESCAVSFDSKDAPFYAPIGLRTEPEKEFEYVTTLLGWHRKMRVDVTCTDGYRLPEERTFELKRTGTGPVTIDLGELKVDPP